MDEKKKQEVKKIRTKLNLISIQKDVLDEKGMEVLLGGGDPGERTCVCKGNTYNKPTNDTTY